MTREELEGALRFAVDVALEAGELTLRYFRRGIDVETKADDTPVTRADRESEQLIRRRISDAYPGSSILGEEFGASSGAGELTWVIDPIDGTKSFVAGVPLYAVLIALVDGAYAGGDLDSDRVLAGVVHAPALGETLCAARGLGARCNGEPASVAGNTGSRGSRITTSDFADLHLQRPRLASLVDERASMTRTWGDAYGYLMVATGRIDAMIDPIISPWDVAPMPVIIEEAGGRFTTLDGRRIVGASALASADPLHQELLSAAVAPAAD